MNWEVDFCHAKCHYRSSCLAICRGTRCLLNHRLWDRDSILNDEWYFTNLNLDGILMIKRRRNPHIFCESKQMSLVHPSSVYELRGGFLSCKMPLYRLTWLHVLIPGAFSIRDCEAPTVYFLSPRERLWHQHVVQIQNKTLVIERVAAVFSRSCKKKFQDRRTKIVFCSVYPETRWVTSRLF